MTEKLKTLTDLLVTKFVGYQGGSLVILTDSPTLEIGRSIKNSASEIGGDIELIDIDSWRSGKPLTELLEDQICELDSKLKGDNIQQNTLLYIMHGLDGEGPMRSKLVDIAGAKGKIGGLPNCTNDVLQAAFNPENKLEFSKELFEFLLGVEEVELTCDRGSQVVITLDHNKYDLVNSNGVLIPEKYANPIPAEVFAHPANVEGTLVISGSYGPLMGYIPFVSNYKALMDTLNKSPLKWTIKKGEITDVECDNKEIKEFVQKEVFEKDSINGKKIGEFGLPANLYVLGREITGNLMIDEKGRVHLANGHGYKPRTRCEYDTKVHGDGLIACASMKAVNLNKQFMEKNKYSSDVFKTLRS